jgi:hypothetical protein
MKFILYLTFLANSSTGYPAARPAVYLNYTGEYATFQACVDASTAIQKQARLPTVVNVCASKGN